MSRFSFHRGSLALDFVGTVGGRHSAQPEERLPDPAALGIWLRDAGLAEAAAPNARDLRDARELREAIHQLMLESVVSRPLDRAARATLNEAAAKLKRATVELDSLGKERWSGTPAVSVALARVAADAIARISADRERLTTCEREGCGALLLSSTRGPRRRWCSMESCGNAAKAAAFRARKQTAGA